jgi:hypothetical protein
MKMAAKKILKLNEKPLIYGRLHHAYPLSIITSHEETMPWFFSNFIQLSCLKNIHPQNTLDMNFLWDDGRFYLNSCPWINYLDIPESFFYHCIQKNIVDFIISTIDTEGYVYLHVDEFYIPEKYSYQKRSYPHCNFIFGYNKDEKVFYTLGYDSLERFKIIQTPFSDLEKSFTNCPPDFRLDVLYFIGQGSTYDFDFDLIRGYIQDYLSSQNSLVKFKTQTNLIYEDKNCVFGMAVYNQLKVYLSSLIEEKAELDVRNLHILWEHKVVMKERFMFMKANLKGDFSNYIKCYEEIENKALIQRCKFLKYSLSKKTKEIISILKGLEEMKDAEEQLLTSFLNS